MGYVKTVKITFDPAKHRAALVERGLDLRMHRSSSLAGPLPRRTRDRLWRVRYQTIGFPADRMVMVVWTPRDEARHVISMRKCNDREKAIYQKQLARLMPSHHQGPNTMRLPNSRRRCCTARKSPWQQSHQNAAGRPLDTKRSVNFGSITTLLRPIARPAAGGRPASMPTCERPQRSLPGHDPKKQPRI